MAADNLTAGDFAGGWEGDTFEHYIFGLDVYDGEEVQRQLNIYGQQGWELVAVSYSLRTYFMKRKLTRLDVRHLA